MFKKSHFYKINKINIVLLLAILNLNGCKKAENAPEATAKESSVFANGAAEATAVPEAMDAAAPAAEAAPARISVNPLASAPPPTTVTSGIASQDIAGRKFLRTAEAKFKVKDVYQTDMALEDAAISQGGFVEKSELSVYENGEREVSTGDGNLKRTTEYTVNSVLILRIPSQNLSGFLKILKQHIEFLDQQNFNAEDVALKILREELARRRNNAAATSLNELRPRDQIEAAHARNDLQAARDEALLTRKELEDRVAFSTLTLTLYQAPKIYTQTVPDLDLMFKKTAPSYFVRLWQNICIGWDYILEFSLYLVVIWPFLLLFGAAFFFVRKYYLTKK